MNPFYPHLTSPKVGEVFFSPLPFWEGAGEGNAEEGPWSTGSLNIHLK